MNLTELQQLLSTLVADSSNNFFTQPERLLALNRACEYMNSEIRILNTVTEVTVAPIDEGRVTLPTDFVSLGRGVAWEALNGQRTNLDYIPLAQLQARNSQWDTESGEPETYVIEGGNFYLVPYPKVAGTVHISYIATPNKLVNGTDVPFYGDPRIQAYHDMIAFYAAWTLVLKDRDFEAGQQFMQYFQSRMVDLRENLRQVGGQVQPVWSDTYSTA